MIMILTHYTADPFTFDPERTYPREARHNGKPQGLWLSDDSDRGWADWCRDEDWGLDGLQHATPFEVDLTRMLVLASTDDLRAFTETYRLERDGDSVLLSYIQINWAWVAAMYDGILITPYQGGWRFAPEAFWYSGWDCASACIWNLAAIRQVSADVAL